jgi:hypothetical protein
VQTRRPAVFQRRHFPEEIIVLCVRWYPRSPQTETSHDDVSLFVPAGSSRSSDWWEADLGTAGATGSQNDIRYAYFPASRRLAIQIGDRVRIYDTGDHEISGVS